MIRSALTLAAFLALAEPARVATLVFGGLGLGMVEGVGDWDPIAAALLAEDPDPISRGGLAGAVDIKLLAPVFAGQRLDYRAVLSRVVDRLIRFEVEATVSGRTVAKGVLTSSRGALHLAAAPGKT